MIKLNYNEYYYTCLKATSQKFDIFLLTCSTLEQAFVLLQITRSGVKPKPLSSRTLACVGFVLSSPVAPGYTLNIIIQIKNET